MNEQLACVGVARLGRNRLLQPFDRDLRSLFPCLMERLIISEQGQRSQGVEVIGLGRERASLIEHFALLRAGKISRLRRHHDGLAGERVDIVRLNGQ